jgi:hypothetical protein
VAKRTKRGPGHKSPRRYKIATIEAAFSLRERKPAAYYQLPQQLRQSVDEYERWLKAQAEQYSNIYATFPPEVRRVLKHSSFYPDSEWSHSPFPVVFEMFRALRKKGRPRLRQTAERIRLAAQLATTRLSIRQAARKLYPGLPPGKACSRTRAFLRDYSQEIEAERKRLDSPR